MKQNHEKKKFKKFIEWIKHEWRVSESNLNVCAVCMDIPSYKKKKKTSPKPPPKYTLKHTHKYTYTAHIYTHITHTNWRF